MIEKLRANRFQYLFVYLLFGTSVASAENCRFEYWEEIPPKTSCEIFRLPDFELEQVEHPSDASQHIQAFCQAYEIRSASTTQRTGYCYTGQGVRTGPHFEVQGIRYVANFNFTGCRGSKPVAGIVFHPAYNTVAAKGAPLRAVKRKPGSQEIDCSSQEPSE
jgi:hypothetical protein